MYSKYANLFTDQKLYTVQSFRNISKMLKETLFPPDSVYSTNKGLKSEERTIIFQLCYERMSHEDLVRKYAKNEEEAKNAWITSPDMDYAISKKPGGENRPIRAFFFEATINELDPESDKFNKDKVAKILDYQNRGYGLYYLPANVGSFEKNGKEVPQYNGFTTKNIEKIATYDHLVFDADYEKDINGNPIGLPNTPIDILHQFIQDPNDLSKTALPLPNSVKFTGGGLHFVYNVKELHLSQTEYTKIYSFIAGELSKRFPIDTKVHNINRFIRVPGSYNVKFGKARLCYVITNAAVTTAPKEDYKELKPNTKIRNAAIYSQALRMNFLDYETSFKQPLHCNFVDRTRSAFPGVASIPMYYGLAKSACYTPLELAVKFDFYQRGFYKISYNDIRNTAKEWKVPFAYSGKSHSVVKAAVEFYTDPREKDLNKSPRTEKEDFVVFLLEHKKNFSRYRFRNFKTDSYPEETKDKEFKYKEVLTKKPENRKKHVRAHSLLYFFCKNAYGTAEIYQRALQVLSLLQADYGRLNCTPLLLEKTINKVTKISLHRIAVREFLYNVFIKYYSSKEKKFLLNSEALIISGIASALAYNQEQDPSERFVLSLKFVRANHSFVVKGKQLHDFKEFKSNARIQIARDVNGRKGDSLENKEANERSYGLTRVSNMACLLGESTSTFVADAYKDPKKKALKPIRQTFSGDYSQVKAAKQVIQLANPDRFYSTIRWHSGNRLLYTVVQVLGTVWRASEYGYSMSLCTRTKMRKKSGILVEEYSRSRILTLDKSQTSLNLIVQYCSMKINSKDASLGMLTSFLQNNRVFTEVHKSTVDSIKEDLSTLANSIIPPFSQEGSSFTPIRKHIFDVFDDEALQRFSLTRFKNEGHSDRSISTSKVSAILAKESKSLMYDINAVVEEYDKVKNLITDYSTKNKNDKNEEEGITEDSINTTEEILVSEDSIYEIVDDNDQVNQESNDLVALSGSQALGLRNK